MKVVVKAVSSPDSDASLADMTKIYFEEPGRTKNKNNFDNFGKNSNFAAPVSLEKQEAGDCFFFNQT